MNFSEIPENPLIFLSWVTALGLFLSLTEATLKIKFEKICLNSQENKSKFERNFKLERKLNSNSKGKKF